jgi:hypothetical protein
MFSQLEGPQAGGRRTHASASLRILFASVLADVQTANVLLAAGRNLAEADSAPEPRFVLEP